MSSLLSDPYFFAVAIPAVVLVGLAKGGLGGSLSILGVPLIALAVPPVQAAAILLPILVVMDCASLWTWRGQYDVRTLKIMLPGALVGIAIGWLTAAFVTESMVRVLIGLIALLFALRWVTQKITGREHARPHRPLLGIFWGAMSGITSFLAHAGGPPYQVYALPLRQGPRLYTGTMVLFFAILNAVKLGPYFLLGQFDTTNLAASAVLAPIAPLATFAGAFIVRRMRPEIFYPFMYVSIFLISIDLLYNGVTGMLAQRSAG